MTKKIYAIPTVEQFVAMHAEVCAELTEQEQRVAAKTAINLAIAWNQSKNKGVDYALNMTPIQRAGLAKFVTTARTLGKADAYVMFAAQQLGIV